MGLRLETDRVIGNIRLLAKGALPEFGRAMYEEIDEVETPECQNRTPVDTGDLQSTVRTTPLVLGPKTAKCGTSAGGYASITGRYVNYAVKVHEDTEAFHANGQAKFIESTYRDSAPYILERVARRVRLARLVVKHNV